MRRGGARADRAGQLRPSARAIVARVGCAPCNLIHHFGSIERLYEHLAAEHATAIALAAGLSGKVLSIDQPYVVPT
jgi:AcrR family transcriptional regulator